MEKAAPSSVRLFVALDLPEPARATLVEWQREVFGGYGRSVRLVKPASLHVTFVFLGHHHPDEVEAIREAAFSRLAGLAAPSLSCAGVTGVPPRRPRLWALDLGDPGGRSPAVQAAVSEPLVAGGWYVPEKRPFWPHLTVARLRARAPAADRRCAARLLVRRLGGRPVPLAPQPGGRRLRAAGPPDTALRPTRY